MKLYNLLLLVLLPAFVFGQKQVKIDWPSLANSPWPLLRGDVQGTGRSDFIGPRTCNIIWKKDMPYGIFQGPLIGYNDVLYTGTDLPSGDTSNYFYAVNKNGTDKWTFRTPGWVPNRAAPILARDSSIYIFSENQHIYALTKDGTLKWTVDLWSNSYIHPSIDKSGNLYFPVITTRDTLYVIAPNGIISKRIYFPKIGGTVSFSFGGDTIYTPTGLTFSTRSPGDLIASDLDGNVYWTYSFPYHNGGIPLVDNANNIYMFGANKLEQCLLYCIKPNGTVKWKYSVQTIFDHYSPTMDKNGNIIFSSIRRINNEDTWVIISLDYLGHENWVTPLKGDFFQNRIFEGVVCDAEGKIYAGGTAPGGNFYCLDSNGVILWQYTSGDFEYDSCPAIGSDGTLYIGYHNGGGVLCTQNLIAIKDPPNSIYDHNKKIVSFNLDQNFPNPFNPTTTIKYQLLKAGNVSLKIYDILGKEITTLVNENKTEGYYEIIFDASKYPSGVYIYQLRSNDFVSSKKMVLIK